MAKDDKIAKELRQIRNLLILIARKSGASAEDIGQATGIGGSNIRGMFPLKKGKKKEVKVRLAQ